MIPRFTHFFLLCTVFFCLPFLAEGVEIQYEVAFKGTLERTLLTKLREVSELELLQDRPPATITALRRRTEADMENLIRLLHSQAYYNAHLSYHINEKVSPVLVTIDIDSGPAYPIAGFRIILEEETAAPTRMRDVTLPSSPPFDTIKRKHLGIKIGDAAQAKTIVNAQKQLLISLEKRNYPLATIKKRGVLIEQTEKAVYIILIIQTGPRVQFGKTTVEGLDKVAESFVRKKIAWDEGEWFLPRKIERTVESLEDSGLFSSANISYHADHEEGESPDITTVSMTISLIEGKHRSIGFGSSYTTQRGPGLSGEWENRNMKGRGEKLGGKAEFWNHTVKATVYYKRPDFIKRDQDFIWIAEYLREETKSYDEYSLSVSGIVDQRVSDELRISYGGTLQRLHSNSIDDNKNYTLVKVPFSLKWSTANNLLDPTKGRTLRVKAIPTAQLLGLNHYYLTTTCTGIIYHPLTDDRQVVLANKLSVGSIFGASRREIPAPERFYAGSENLLRGYSYLTVSPLNATGDPIGGRSFIVWSTEERIRVSEHNAFVMFYEVGGVFRENIPKMGINQLHQSVGVGWRYSTAIGPIRLDLAFPLDRRPELDNYYLVYFSIGQAF